MAILRKTNLTEIVESNRWSAEFFDPAYIFSENNRFQWTKIGNVLTRAQYGLSLSMNEENIGVPMYRMNEMDKCFVKDAKKYAIVSEKEIENYLLEMDDVLFNRTNSYEFVGRTGILKHEVNSVFASYLIRLNTKKNLILPEFLTIYLNTTFGIGQIKRRAMRSVNQANVSASELKQIKIPLVDMNNQVKIKNLVDTSFTYNAHAMKLYKEAIKILDDEIDLNYTEDTKKFSNKFVTFFSDIATKKRFDGEHFQTKYQFLRNKLSNYGSEKLLKNISYIKPNFVPEKEEIYYYAQLSDIDNSIGIIDSYSILLGKDAPSRAKRLTQNGDLLISSVVGSLDKSALIQDKHKNFLVSNGFFQFRSNFYPSEYLLILFQSDIIKEQFKQEAGGGILSAVADSNLKNIIIPTVKKEIIEKIFEKVKEAFEYKEKSLEVLEKAILEVEEIIKNSIN